MRIVSCGLSCHVNYHVDLTSCHVEYCADPFYRKRNIARSLSHGQIYEYIEERLRAAYKYFSILPQRDDHNSTSVFQFSESILGDTKVGCLVAKYFVYIGLLTMKYTCALSMNTIVCINHAIVDILVLVSLMAITFSVLYSTYLHEHPQEIQPVDQGLYRKDWAARLQQRL